MNSLKSRIVEMRGRRRVWRQTVRRHVVEKDLTAVLGQFVDDLDDPFSVLLFQIGALVRF